MHTVLIAATIFFTSISAVGLGVVVGYASIWAILAAFGRHSSPQPALVAVKTATAPSR